MIDHEHDERNEQYLEAPLDPALLPLADEIVRLASSCGGWT